jgi:hypothetical protein
MNKIAVESRLYNSSRTLAISPDRPVFPEGEEEAYLSVQPFSYQLPRARWGLSRATLPATALMAWLIGVAALVSRSSSRIDVD